MSPSFLSPLPSVLCLCLATLVGLVSGVSLDSPQWGVGAMGNMDAFNPSSSLLEAQGQAHPPPPIPPSLPSAPSLDSSFLEVGSHLTAGDPMLGLVSPPVMGYTPISSPFDNPATDLELTPVIPNSPDCTVRPQTVVEIHNMRMSAARIAAAIQTEVSIMQKRKAYVEQMTNYLNDRIRELNKVKSELSTEARWIEASNARIQELSEKEKLIKYQDILACLNGDSKRLQGEDQTKKAAMAGLQAKAKQLQASVDAIRTNINNIRSGAPSTGGEEATTE